MVSEERRIDLATWYNRIHNPRGFGLAPHHYPLVAGLEDQRIDSLLYLAGPGTGKSSLLDIAYSSWELGHDPTLTILAISAGEALVQGFMSSVMQMIQHDPTFREVFPDVRPDPTQGWSLQRGLFVTGHPATDPDASYAAVGIGSKRLTGLHARLHIYDDLHDRENAQTPESRQVVKDTYYDTIMGRADPRGVRRVAAGRWWAPDDICQEWRASGDWVVLELPAVRPKQRRLWYDVFVPRGKECIYTETLEPAPEEEQSPSSPFVRYRAYYGAIDSTGKGFYWPGSPSKRQEYEAVARRRPRVAAVNYRGDMSATEDAVFRVEDFGTYLPPEGLANGRDGMGVREWMSAFPNAIVEDAWDTALGQVQSASLTVGLTALLVPCDRYHRNEDADLIGPCDFHYDVMLLDILAEDWEFGRLVAGYRTNFGKWQPRRSNVEDKQSGVSLVQVLRGAAYPIHPIKVVRGKLARAVDPVMVDKGSGKPVPGGPASAQGWTQMGRVSVPGGAPWVPNFLSKVCSYSGGDANTDEFDALVHIVTRAIQMSSRTVRMGAADGLPLDDERVPMGIADDPKADARQTLAGFAGLLGQASMAINPLAGMCAAPCAHFGVNMAANSEWCFLRERKTTSVSGCDRWKQAERVYV